MIINALKLTLDQNQDKPKPYLRNLLKEQLQYYILNYIWNSEYAEQFLFKGGTCLRFCFDLPRLSEDLDFDIKNINHFDWQKFANDLKLYFNSKLKYQDLDIKISGKNRLLYLQFPVLDQIGYPISKPSENVLFVRIDLSPVRGKHYQTEISLKSTWSFSFIIRRYSLPDLFAGKVATILTREAFEGPELKPRFKGRDYFDLLWFTEKQTPLNYRYLFSITDFKTQKQIKQAVEKKLIAAFNIKSDLQTDLKDFFADPQFVKFFVNNLDKLTESGFNPQPTK
jgi:predicted nucleotidyltransferase component of viral defense system